MKKEIVKEEPNLKKFIIPMIILDIIGIGNLILEIHLKEISYGSYVILILCNIIVFGINILKRKGK